THRAINKFVSIDFGGSGVSLSFFLFQAEDGIRDGHVTGVQTCALPISGEFLLPKHPAVVCPSGHPQNPPATAPPNPIADLSAPQGAPDTWRRPHGELLPPDAA